MKKNPITIDEIRNMTDDQVRDLNKEMTNHIIEAQFKAMATVAVVVATNAIVKKFEPTIDLFDN